MSDLNKTMLIGRLGQDPDMRYSSAGTALCAMSVATSERYKDKQGQPQERTQWHRVKAFGKLAEICGRYLRKGDRAYFEGTLRTSKYTGKDGIERYSTDIILRDMKMLGGNKAAGQQGKPQQQAYQPQGFENVPDFEIDDIPF